MPFFGRPTENPMSDEQDSREVEAEVEFDVGDDTEVHPLAAELEELKGLSAEELAELDRSIGEENLSDQLSDYRIDDDDSMNLDDVVEGDIQSQLADYLDDEEDFSDLDFDAEPVNVDEDWRDEELEKLIIGGTSSGPGVGKFILAAMAILMIGFVGWMVFAPGPDRTAERLASLPALPELQPEPPAPPPPPPPPPRPYRDLFEVQTGFDGETYIAYTLQPDDDLQTIGEKLHDVTGAPRPVTYLAIEDAYWRKYFSYQEQNIEVVTPEEVAGHVGETIQIPVPVPEFPDYDLVALVEEYNQP